MNPQTHPSYTIISWEEFKEKFNIRFQMPFQSYREEMAEIRLYEADADGNVRFTADFSADDEMNIVIHGNLIVEGNLSVSGEGMGNFMYVTGNVAADSIVVSGVGTLSVDGDITCKHGILGCYGDDGGYLDVDGKIITPVIINTTYFNMFLKHYDGAVAIDLAGGFLDTDYNDHETAATILHPDVMDEAGNIEIRLIAKALLAGKPVLKSGV